MCACKNFALESTNSKLIDIVDRAAHVSHSNQLHDPQKTQENECSLNSLFSFMFISSFFSLTHNLETLQKVEA